MQKEVMYLICSSCMEVKGDFKDGFCRSCYEAMMESTRPVSDKELNELIKEFEE